MVVHVKDMAHACGIIAELGICTINYSGDYDFKGAKES